jgi:uncharacterized membrane protein HdeD (DUF308 family)
MSINQSDIDRMQNRMATVLHAHWVMFLIEGLVLLGLGIAAIVIPPIATVAVAIFLGWLFLVSGAVGLAMTFWMRNAPGFIWSLLSAVLGIAAGVVLIGWPMSGALSLTLVLIVFFVMEGVASIMFALDHRSQLPGRWSWMLASGVVDLALATVIVAGLPGTAAWAIGLMVGINMVLGGTALVMMALQARRLAPPATLG